MIVLLDNFDSFVYNLARYFEELGFSTYVVRSNKIELQELVDLKPSHLVLSPGPCTPHEAGICIEAVQRLYTFIPILGVCLGHQAIAIAFGGNIKRAPTPMHGKASLVQHQQQGLFYDLPNPLKVGRYHSLIVDEVTLPSMLKVTASTSDGVIMAMQHMIYPTFGVQFHPESILTESGYALLNTFLGSNNR